jgi:predicted NUDIX family phosphoesterase
VLCLGFFHYILLTGQELKRLSSFLFQINFSRAIERKVLEKAGMFQGLAIDVERYRNEIFAPGAARFMKRSQVEKDPSFKQLIPYVIMSCDGKYLSYVRGRRAGESRLVGQRSIGIGGHINNSDDMPLFNDNFYETYLAAVKREVAEEVTVETGYTDRVIALLNDESNEVGSVHLGIVHHWILNSPKVSRREQMITQMAFMTAAELREVRDTLETWSGLCLGHLSELTRNGKFELGINA